MLGILLFGILLSFVVGVAVGVAGYHYLHKRGHIKNRLASDST